MEGMFETGFISSHSGSACSLLSVVLPVASSGFLPVAACFLSFPEVDGIDGGEL